MLAYHRLIDVNNRLDSHGRQVLECHLTDFISPIWP